MAGPIDTSAPLLLPSQLAALVAAVEKADRDGEHNWIEWKRSLDLTAKTSHEHIAKHVLGFGNRLVQTAALHMGGYGYILIGVEPGSVLGVETIDPATLTDVIMGYVGTDGPGYHTEYVSVGDRTVLVIVVNPPKHGDPVHTLRKNLGPTSSVRSSCGASGRPIRRSRAGTEPWWTVRRRTRTRSRSMPARSAAPSRAVHRT